MKRASEGEFGAALRAIDPDPSIFVYKPPDDARNWKPCDYMVWYEVGEEAARVKLLPRSAWFECKDTAALGTWSWHDMRPSQLRGIDEAARLGIRYFIAVFWRRSHLWTISDGRAMMWTLRPEYPTSFTLVELSSRFGVDSSPAQLSSTLRAILQGD